VTCVLGDTTNVPRGYSQLFIDNVSTGVSIFVDNPLVPNINLLLCSGTATRSRSRSNELTMTETVTLSETTSGPSSSHSSTVGTMTLDASSSLTITADETVTGTALRGSASASGAFTTATTSDTRTIMTATRSPSEAENSASVTLTETLIVSATDTVSRTDPSHTDPSHTGTISASATFGCVTPSQLAAAMLPYHLTPPMATLHDLDVQRGVNASLVLFPIPNIERNSLHIPWFQPVTCPVRLMKRMITNSGGFREYLWASANLTVFFLQGLGASSTLPHGASRNGAVRIEVPAMPDYHIFETEIVDLEIPASCATLSFICNATYNNVTLRYDESVEGIRLMRLAVVPSDSPVRTSALSVLQPIVIVAGLLGGTPHAIANVQLITLHAMSGCGTAFQRTSFAVDALSTLIPGYEVGKLIRNGSNGGIDEDVWASLIYGAVFWLVASFILQHVVVACVACCGRRSTSDARALARCPSVWLHCGYAYTLPGAVFAALQKIAQYSSSPRTTVTTASALEALANGAVRVDAAASTTAFVWSLVLLCCLVVVVPGLLLFRLYFGTRKRYGPRSSAHDNGSGIVDEVLLTDEDDDEAFGVPLSQIIPSLAPKAISVDEDVKAKSSTKVAGPPTPQELLYGDHELCLTYSVYQYHKETRRSLATMVAQSCGPALISTPEEFDCEDEATSYEMLLFDDDKRLQSRARLQPVVASDGAIECAGYEAQSGLSSWRAGDRAPWGIRWLSQSLLLPIGVWGPEHRRRTYGLFLSHRFARSERFWWALEILACPVLVSAVLVAAHGGADGNDNLLDAWPVNNSATILGVDAAPASACHGVLSAVSLIYVIRIAVIQRYQPFNIRLEMYLSHTADVVQVMYFILASCQLATPRSTTIEVLLVVCAAIQLAVLLISTVHVLVQCWWIQPAIAAHVKQRLTFAWCNAPAAPPVAVTRQSVSLQEKLLGSAAHVDSEEHSIRRGADNPDGRALHSASVWLPSELESGDVVIRSRHVETLLKEMRHLGVLPYLLEQDSGDP
jgi:hypothetical protein